MSVAVDAAVVAKLQADATLLGLAPGGVFPDLAPEQTPTPYLIVALDSHEDVDEENQVAFENAVYLVMAIDKADDAAGANAAYARAHTVLTGSALTASGVTVMDVTRRGRVRLAERDGSVIWRFVGGRYLVMVDPS